MTTIAIGLAALLASACSEPPPEATAPVVRPVKIFTIAQAGAAATREYPGSVKATLDSNVAFEVPGRIVEFPVVEGQEVEAGALIARLDDSDYRDARDKARARRDAARADVARYEEAIKANAVTQQDVDLARRNLDVADADLRTAQKALADTRLTAPFAGVVARKEVPDFANVQAKQPIIKLQDRSGLEMTVDVPEQNMAQANPNWSMEELTRQVRPRVVISALPDREFAARITEISTAADPVTRTFKGTVAFDPPGDVAIQPGMTGKIVVDVADDGSWSTGTSIPANATRADAEGNAFVWIIDEEMRARRTPVTLGELTGDNVIVVAGLEPGDRIAASGVHNLNEGMQIRELTN